MKFLIITTLNAEDPENFDKRLIEGRIIMDNLSWTLTVLAVGIYLIMGVAEVSESNFKPWNHWHNSLKPRGQAGPEITLSVSEETDYLIVIPDESTTQEKKAAADLAHWLQEITGATFPIIHDSQTKDDEKIISIGCTSQFMNADIKKSKIELKDEGYGITVRKHQLFLWGGRTGGIINAVYALLEEDLGCRWYTDEHTRIPEMQSLVFSPVSRTYVPRLRLRDPYYKVAFNGTWSLHNRTNAPSAKVPEEWGGHMDYDGLFVHTFHRLLPPEKYFADHPEYFMLDEKGKRITHQLCTTNPDVIQLVIESVREFLKNNPHTEIISVSKTDGGRTCQCENCRGLDEAEGSEMASLLYLVNKVGEAIEDEYPDLVISTLAYLETVKPPKTMRPGKNIAIRLCNDSVGSWVHPFTPAEQCQFGKLLKAWSAIHDRIHIWDYVVNFSHYLAPMPNMHVIAKNIRFFVENNAEGIMTQGAYQSPGAERDWMRSWVIAKLTWDPSRNISQLMQDFIWGHYGNAAQAIAEYNDLLQKTGQEHKEQLSSPEGGIRYRMDHPFLSKRFLDRSDEIFDRAENVAEDDAILRRVELARLPIMYVRLVRGPEFTGERYGDIIQRFEEIAKREGVLHLREGSPDLDEKLQTWYEAWHKSDISD
ncbi:DUF4838 domain-containing protein [Candidatus Poribacteria bacterium]|nr:DUF4838 domain-containing protein [Candidatus Poribacteria bacterium]